MNAMNAILIVLMVGSLAEAVRSVCATRGELQEEIDWARISERRWFQTVTTLPKPRRHDVDCKTIENVTTYDGIAVFQHLLYISRENGMKDAVPEISTAALVQPAAIKYSRDRRTLGIFGLTPCSLEELEENDVLRRVFESEILVKTDYENYLVLSVCNYIAGEDDIVVIYTDESNPAPKKILDGINAWTAMAGRGIKAQLKQRECNWP